MKFCPEKLHFGGIHLSKLDETETTFMILGVLHQFEATDYLTAQKPSSTMEQNSKKWHVPLSLIPARGAYPREGDAPRTD